MTHTVLMLFVVEHVDLGRRGLLIWVDSKLADEITSACS